MDLHLIINREVISSLYWSGVLTAAVILIGCAIHWGFSRVAEFNQDHPVVLKLGALFISAPLWFLAEGTWIAGVLGVLSIGLILALVADLRRGKQV